MWCIERIFLWSVNSEWRPFKHLKQNTFIINIILSDILGWVNNYLQCSFICVSVGSTVVFTFIARRAFHLITTVQVWSRSVSPFVPTVTLSMAAPLSVCTKEEQRLVIRFLWSEGVSGVEIHRRLSPQYRNSVLPKRSVYEWIEVLKNGRTGVTHEGSGAGVACCSATTIFFWGHKEAPATVEEVHWKARRLCWKMMLLWVLYFYWNKVCICSADNYWLTNVFVIKTFLSATS